MQYLLDALSFSAQGRGVALLDDRGRLLAGAGSSREMWAVARAVQARRASACGEALGCAWIETRAECLRLAALGFEGGSAELGNAAQSVGRILES
jgi:sugar (pentulose or hexulose) kinase